MVFNKGAKSIQWRKDSQKTIQSVILGTLDMLILKNES